MTIPVHAMVRAFGCSRVPQETSAGGIGPSRVVGFQMVLLMNFLSLPVSNSMVPIVSWIALPVMDFLRGILTKWVFLCIILKVEKKMCRCVGIGRRDRLKIYFAVSYHYGGNP